MTLNYGLFGVVTGVKEGFVHVDMGLGNHLFVNKIINKEFQDIIKEKSPNEIYRDWIDNCIEFIKIC